MPQRTCIAYKHTAPASTLLRVVVQDGVIIPDPTRRLPGRGAWITPTLPAVSLAESRNAFARSLKVSTPVDTGELRKYVCPSVENKERLNPDE